MATARTFKPYTKTEIIDAIQALPENATVDDAMECLYVMAKIEISHAQLAKGEGISHEEIVREMEEWQD